MPSTIGELISSHDIVRIPLTHDKVLIGFALGPGRPGLTIEIAPSASLIADEHPIAFEILQNFINGWSEIVPHLRSLRRETASSILHVRSHELHEIVFGAEVGSKAWFAGGRDVPAGGLLNTDDILFHAELILHGATIPKVGQFFFTCQHQWRRIVSFDFSATPSTLQTYPLDFQALTLPAFNRIHMAHRVSMDESILTRMACDGWYPFARLPKSLQRLIHDDYLLDYPRNESEDKVLAWLSATQITPIEAMLKSLPCFSEHADRISRGLDHYRKNDFLSSVSVLMPVVEGVMWRLLKHDATNRYRHADLIAALDNAVSVGDAAIGTVLASGFANYLKTHIFAPFNLFQGLLPFSRNTVLHGTSRESDFTQLNAARLVLTLDHIAICLAASGMKPTQ